MKESEKESTEVKEEEACVAINPLDDDDITNYVKLLLHM